MTYASDRPPDGEPALAAVTPAELALALRLKHRPVPIATGADQWPDR